MEWWVQAMIQKVTVADSCWMLDSDSGLWPGDLGETEMDFRRTSEDIYKEYIVNEWGISRDNPVIPHYLDLIRAIGDRVITCSSPVAVKP